MTKYSAWIIEKKYFKVEALQPATEILPLLGSKEGIMHICMTYLNEGDAVLIPNPGYPTYSSAVSLAGGTPLFYELTEENHWEPNFENLEKLTDEAIENTNNSENLKEHSLESTVLFLNLTFSSNNE